MQLKCINVFFLLLMLAPAFHARADRVNDLLDWPHLGQEFTCDPADFSLTPRKGYSRSNLGGTSGPVISYRLSGKIYLPYRVDHFGMSFHGEDEKGIGLVTLSISFPLFPIELEETVKIDTGFFVNSNKVYKRFIIEVKKDFKGQPEQIICDESKEMEKR